MPIANNQCYANNRKREQVIQKLQKYIDMKKEMQNIKGQSRW